MTRVYILTKEGRDISEPGKQQVRNEVAAERKVTPEEVAIYGGKAYNDIKYFSGILKPVDVVGVSVPEKGQCYFISDAIPVGKLKKLLKKAAPATTSWQIAKDFIEP